MKFIVRSIIITLVKLYSPGGAFDVGQEVTQYYYYCVYRCIVLEITVVIAYIMGWATDAVIGEGDNRKLFLKTMDTEVLKYSLVPNI